MSRPRLTYRPGTSLLHQLHPLVKAAWLTFLTVFVFTAPALGWVVALLAISLGAFVLLGVHPGEVGGVRLFVFTAVLLAVLQVLFTHDGIILAQVGPITITDLGIKNGVYIGARFLCVILFSYLFVLTTSPNDLAYGLMQVRLPYRYGFALVTALRFVPIFEKEAQTIYQAQLMRGVRYDRGNIRRLLTLARQFTLPILVSALRKVDALAVSMEGEVLGGILPALIFDPSGRRGKDWLALVFLVLTILVFMLG